MKTKPTPPPEKKKVTNEDKRRFVEAVDEAFAPPPEKKKEEWQKQWIDFQFRYPLIRCRYCDFDEDKQKPKVCKYHKKFFTKLLSHQRQELREAIVQLAIKGKDDPDDEKGINLYTRILSLLQEKYVKTRTNKS